MEITSNFKENLAQLPSVENISELTLTDSNNTIVGQIENKQGQAGSLAVYAYLINKFSMITPEAAELGLKIYAEHTMDAEANPGKHPNIDRLFEVVSKNLLLTAVIIKEL